ncbi:hypothetical protein ACFE04_003716 [Oxalis oulophora]
MFNIINVLVSDPAEVYTQKNNGPTKLFVFGDSYVDAGNRDPPSVSWFPPYGITFPGKPSGSRISWYTSSDSLQVKTICEAMATEKRNELCLYGGSGVFMNMVGGPTVGEQIGFLQQLVQQNVYTKQDLASSVALVSYAGNDYGVGGRGADPGFRATVINQLAMDLKSLKELGVRKVAVTTLQPVGCLPGSTASSGYTRCDETINLLVQNHNQLLSQAVQSLNGNHGGSFFIVDIYNGFLTALKNQSRPAIINLIHCAVRGESPSSGTIYTRHIMDGSLFIKS